MKNLKTIILITQLIMASSLYGQVNKTVAERLGYPKNAKLLIIHADDMGVAHSVNEAVIKGFVNKGISSGSIMVPCAWFPEIAEFTVKNKNYDIGIHLTLTAEWQNYKWGGVSSSNEIQSLLDKDGYFYPSVEEFAKNAKPEEVEKEIRAQIDRAIANGIKPTHLDNHMGSLLAIPQFLDILLKIGKDYKIPVFLPANLIPKENAKELEALRTQIVLVDELFMLNSWPVSNNWFEAYSQMITSMKPGLNELIVHLAIDDSEMKAISVDHKDFGSEWRQNDLNLMISQEFKELLNKNNIILVKWRDIQNLK